MEGTKEVLGKIKTAHGDFTEDKENGLTAEEFYQKWLLGLNQPTIQEPNKIDILAQNVLDLVNIVEAILIGGYGE